MTTHRGELLAYAEQGAEGRIVYALQVEDLPQPIPFANGQRLIIFESDRKILWEGEIMLVRRWFFEKHRLKTNVWADTKQKGVSYAEWMSWFWRIPPLKAKLETREES